MRQKVVDQSWVSRAFFDLRKRVWYHLGGSVEEDIEEWSDLWRLAYRIQNLESGRGHRPQRTVGKRIAVTKNKKGY